MEDLKDVEDKIKKAKDIVEKMKLEEPYKSLTFKKLLDIFLLEIRKQETVLEEQIIKSEKSTTSTALENISSLFNSEWGRTPRLAQEVIEQLKLEAIYYPKSTIFVTLMRLVRKGILRRIPEEGQYKYVVAR